MPHNQGPKRIPSRQEFIKSASVGSITPLYVGLPDFASPAAVYKAFSGQGSALLESAKGPFNIARYSFVCFDPYCEYTIKNGSEVTRQIRTGKTRKAIEHRPLRSIKALLKAYNQSPVDGLPPFQGGAIALFCYDFVHYLEKLPATTEDDLDLPDAHILMVDKLIAFDHMLKKAWAIVCPGAAGGIRDWGLAYDDAIRQLQSISDKAGNIVAGADEPHKAGTLEITRHCTEDEYTSMVDRGKEYIASGDIFQANLSLRLSAEIGSISPWTLYERLREINPSPFAGFLDFGTYQIASSSPERLVKIDSGIVQTRPIAGTRPREGGTAKDEAMRKELLLSDKERAEHIMLIDLERNDIGKVCDYGSVSVDELMITEDYSHVIHIVSNVRGRLASNKSLVDIVRATFPGGTITGVPKVRCMEIIDELEKTRRGPYTGSFGYMGFSGNMDLNIIIRTFTIKGGRAYVQAGAGIVADSMPEREYKESLRKAEALIKTLQSLSP